MHPIACPSTMHGLNTTGLLLHIGASPSCHQVFTSLYLCYASKLSGIRVSQFIQELSSSKFGEYFSNLHQHILSIYTTYLKTQPEFLGLSEARWPFLSTSTSISTTSRTEWWGLWQLWDTSCLSLILTNTCKIHGLFIKNIFWDLKRILFCWLILFRNAVSKPEHFLIDRGLLK